MCYAFQQARRRPTVCGGDESVSMRLNENGDQVLLVAARSSGSFRAGYFSENIPFSESIALRRFARSMTPPPASLPASLRSSRERFLLRAFSAAAAAIFSALRR